METRTLDHVATTLAAPRTRRDALRLVGAALLGVSGVRAMVTETEAKRGKSRKKSRQPRQEALGLADPFVDVAITAIFVEQTSEAGHDDVVIQFVNNGMAPASRFRIGMTAKSADGLTRNEMLTLPITLAPGQRGSERFRLGCRWINGATVTARTSPSPVPGEPGTATKNNVATARFGAAICVSGTEGSVLPGA